MAKLSNIAKGTKAIKAVPFRPANAPLLAAGQESDEHTKPVGVRVLAPGEIREIYECAQASALKGGAPQWLDTHPLCRYHLMVQTLAVACVDADSGERAEPFFVSVEEIETSPAMGGDNIAYLYEQHRLWEDECGGREKHYTPEEMIQIIIREAERPENAPDSPFSRLGPSSRLSLEHSICVLCTSLLTVRSVTSLPGESSSTGKLPQKNLPQKSRSKTRKARR